MKILELENEPLSKLRGMAKSLRKRDAAVNSEAVVGLDRLNIAEPLRTAILSRTHSEQEVGEVLKCEPSSSETDVGGFQMLR